MKNITIPFRENGFRLPSADAFCLHRDVVLIAYSISSTNTEYYECEIYLTVSTDQTPVRLGGF